VDAVLGDGPLAEALVAALAASGPVVLASRAPVVGPFFWRRANLATGEGIVAALRDARRAFVIVEPGDEARGFFSVVRPGAVQRGVAVLPLGAAPPAGLERHADWSHVEVGVVWGPGEPLVRAWTSDVAAGHRVWLADPGPVRPLAVRDVVATVRAAGEHRGMRWVLAGREPARLPDLAAAVGRALGKPVRTLRVPLALAARRAGVLPVHITRWLSVPDTPSRTPGFEPPHTGAAGWAAGEGAARQAG
jgi:uncharacterized protein YbjT (DUF2867 family)